MKFKDIETTPEEVMQSLKDAGIEFSVPGDADYDTLAEITEYIKARALLIDDLYNIAVELDAREFSNNCVVDNLQRFSWNELCDKGIEILAKLKEI